MKSWSKRVQLNTEVVALLMWKPSVMSVKRGRLTL